ncbi:MAG: DUF5655 domain-containing protein [Candidatus Bathyarchaeia archaeon]|jgi:hypothetical protein
MTKGQEKQQTIDEILSSLTPSQKTLIQNLRKLVKDSVPETVETVKQGKIVYKLEDRDFVWVSRYQTHMDLEFAMGASLSSDMLRSRGIAEQNENVRHVFVNNFPQQEAELQRLLKKAATLSFEHCQTG